MPWSVRVKTDAPIVLGSIKPQNPYCHHLMWLLGHRNIVAEAINR